MLRRLALLWTFLCLGLAAATLIAERGAGPRGLRMTAEPGLRLRDGEGVRTLNVHGYTHFEKP